jgi:hypothetical protein
MANTDLALNRALLGIPRTTYQTYVQRFQLDRATSG